MERTQFKDLNLSNAFLFAAAMTEPENCRLMLEMILGREFAQTDELNVHAEHTILYNSDYKSVRLDVYISEKSDEPERSDVEYDVEMQANSNTAIAKRSRYYQAVMDATTYERGFDYSQMKPNFVIFICTYDPFQKGLYRYSFENRCMEADFPLGDGTRKIFLNTKGRNSNDVPDELVAFLKYVEDSTDACAQDTGSVQVKQLHANITQLKKNRELEDQFMTVGELIEDAERQAEARGEQIGEARGKQEAEQRMADLLNCLLKDGRTELLPRTVTDPDFREQLYREYNL